MFPVFPSRVVSTEWQHQGEERSVADSHRAAPSRLPSFWQQGDYNAYSEGWRFTQRAWAKVTGFYQDPYSDYGRLSSELLRAVRLVLSIQVFTTSPGLANR